jgi:hypothetical protein
VGRNIGKAGNALGLLGVGAGKVGHFSLEIREQIEQFGPALILDCLRLANSFLNLADGVLNHKAAVKLLLPLLLLRRPWLNRLKKESLDYSTRASPRPLTTSPMTHAG